MNEVSQGTWVKLTGFDPGEEEVFSIVLEDQANLLENEIPIGSPLARALDGAKVGEKVAFHAPAGELQLTILEVGQL